MPAPRAVNRLAELLSRFPTDLNAVTEFDTVARPILTRMSRRAAWFLAADQRDGDVVQQAMSLLVSGTGGTYDPARASAEAFLWLVVRRATREVAAMYTEPGRRTRPPKPRPIEQVEARSRKRRVIGVEAEPDPMEAVEQRCDVSAVLRAAPRPVAHALRRIHLEDAPVSIVAAELGMSRFSMMRAIARFATAYAA